MTNFQDIQNCAISFYQKLLTSEGTSNCDELLSFIPTLVNQEQNDFLLRPPLEEEIKITVFSMDANSAPGPDGFPGLFFTHCWPIVKKEVVDAVLDFFHGGTLSRSYTSSFLVLIPKVEQPISMSDFRPISLCNFIYKIIARIFSDRLSSILPSIISPQQGAFVKDRSIFDNIELAQELFHDLNRKVWGGNMIIKCDMAKAYDRLEWSFLFAVLLKFGFSDMWIEFIKKMFTNCWFSIMLNGTIGGYFKSSRGLRQGDPLAPSLFILAEEVLSRGLYALMQNNVIHRFKSPRGCPLVSHLLFADDTIIFTNGNLRSLSNLMQFLKLYENASGQKINKQKSCFVVPSSTLPLKINITLFKDALVFNIRSLLSCT